MRIRVRRLALALLLAPAIFAIPPQEGKTNRVPPPWAYGLKTPLGSPPSPAFRHTEWARTGTWTDMMKPVVEKLTIDDMINIAAYLSSRKIGDAQ